MSFTDTYPGWIDFGWLVGWLDSQLVVNFLYVILQALLPLVLDS